MHPMTIIEHLIGNDYVLSLSYVGNRHYTDDKGQEQGIKNAGSTLHFGSDFWHNKWPKAHGEKYVA